ncbi:Predicted dehydrogenase [bacterium A37T11]|nr:Predicted dehydrogenase [bacterium A37T11]
MPTDRRNFLRHLTFLSGAVAAGAPSLAKAINPENPVIYTQGQKPQQFNMSGYAAPKIPTVRVGIIGLGMRGPGAVNRLSMIEGVEIKALCDKDLSRVTKAQSILEKQGLPQAKAYSGEDGWKAMIDKEDLDLVYTCTPWYLHTPICLYAMEHGRHVASEVPIALTLDEAWSLVETSEKTKKHCMMLENCCYDFFEMLTLNMTRNGMFGELVHAEGAYLHNLLDLNFNKNGYADMWRLKQNGHRNGNLYPTHGLGPIAQCLNINRGDKMDHLVSMSSGDFMMADEAKKRAATDDFYKPFVGLNYRGNMNNTIIHTQLNKTILVQHDVTSPHVYSRIHKLVGTKGIVSKYPVENISLGDDEWLKEQELKDLYDKHTPELINHVGEVAKKVGGHGGMDFVMDWRLIDCLRNGLPLDQDVYDGALWSVIGPLSEQSVAGRSKTIDIPDFTKGAWKTNKPVNLTLDGGGTTQVRNQKG